MPLIFVMCNKTVQDKVMSVPFLHSAIFFFNVYVFIFEREREREHKLGRGRERERHRIEAGSRL